MTWLDTVKKLAPTVASALGGPAAGIAITALGELFGISEPTQDKIKDFVESGKLSADHVFELKRLELQYQNDEKERGFKYADLEYKDRDSARKASVEGGTLNKLFWFSIWLVTTVLVSELIVLRYGIPHGVPEIVVGRILGLLDSIAIQVLNFWYGTSSGSVRKTDLMVSK